MIAYKPRTLDFLQFAAWLTLARQGRTSPAATRSPRQSKGLSSFDTATSCAEELGATVKKTEKKSHIIEHAKPAGTSI